MEKERKEPEKDRTQLGQGEQYLLAMIKCADWVPRPYKSLVNKNVANIAVIKELYLCACDGISIDKAVEALEKNPPEGALRFLRQKHMENLALGNYQDELSGIKKTTSSLEQEVRSMSEMLTHIATHVPNFDAMFPDADRPENEPVGKATSKDQPLQEHTEAEISDTAQADLPADSPETETQQKESILETGIQKGIQKFRNLKKSLQKRSISDFMEKRLEEGYSPEQMNYFLDCIEEGMDLSEITKIASPKLPVEMMQRLRMVEQRKEKQNGK